MTATFTAYKLEERSGLLEFHLCPVHLAAVSGGCGHVHRENRRGRIICRRACGFAGAAYWATLDRASDAEIGFIGEASVEIGRKRRERPAFVTGLPSPARGASPAASALRFAAFGAMPTAITGIERHA